METEVEDLSREELLEEVQGLDSNTIEFLRESAKNDLYTLSKGILGYKDVDPDVHGEACIRIVEEPKLRRLWLFARGHLKSTLFTVADSIRITLVDPVEARTLIVNEIERTAADFLTEIKNHWEQNALLRQLFPELVPKRLSGPGITWSGTEALLPVEGRIAKEPHWRALGVGGGVTGLHFHRIKCDDLIGFEAAHSPTVMQRTVNWNGNITSLLVDQNVDVIDWIGTRWSRNDLYQQMMLAYGSKLAVYTRAAIENGQIIFPAKHTADEYQYLQDNFPMIWFAQYENNPLAGGKQDLPAGNIKTYYFSLDGQHVYYRLENGEDQVWHIDQLDKVLTADPNSGAPDAPDTAAICVTGVSPKNEVFVLHSDSSRWTPTEFVDEIYKVAKRWRIRRVGIEKAGQQNTQHYFEIKAKDEQYYVQVEPLTPKNRHKPERIRGNIQPILNSGRLFCLTGQTVLRTQIGEFPENTGDIVDELDALAYGPELWRTPMHTEQQEKNRAIHKKILGKRNVRTGY